MSIKFIADSMCDLSEEVLRRYPFEVLPVPIAMGDKTYSDGVDITPKMVFDFVENNSGSFPKTSQVQAITYKQAFETHLKNGDDIICLTLSSELSGTYQSASLMANDLKEAYPDRTISVIDSRCASTGMMLIMHQGLKLNKLGKSMDEIVETMTFLCQHINVFFLVGDIKWLAKGGRISKSVATIGDMLKIVPILYMEDGRILAYDKVRGKKKAQKKFMEIVSKLITNPNQICGVINTTNQELEEKTIKFLKKDLGVTDVIAPTNGGGSALSVHIGKDCIGVMFFDELPENYIPVLP